MRYSRSLLGLCFIVLCMSISLPVSLLPCFHHPSPAVSSSLSTNGIIYRAQLFFQSIITICTIWGNRKGQKGASLVAQMIKNLPAIRRPCLDPWVRRSPGEENGYPLQYSCLESSTDRGLTGLTASNQKLLIF